MKTSGNRRKLTFLLIPDAANHSIRRVQLAYYWLIVIGMTLIIIVSGLFIWQLSSHRQFQGTISKLQGQVSEQRQQYEELKTDKNHTIENLQSEIVQLSEQADVIQQKIEEIEQLEEEIKNHSLITSSARPVTIAQDEPNSERKRHVGGINGPVSDEQMQQFIHETKQELLLSDEELDLLNQDLQQVKHLLNEKLELLKHTPSIRPVDSAVITSSYGIRRDPFTGSASFHYGIDFDGDTGDPVYAAADGTVEETATDGSRGRYIVIHHGNGLKTVYMHLSKFHVQNGEVVEKGDMIGEIGSTGRSTGAHLHYEVHKNGSQVNPNQYLP